MAAFLNKVSQMLRHTCRKKALTPRTKSPSKRQQDCIRSKMSKALDCLQTLHDEEFITRRWKCYVKDWLRALRTDLEREENSSCKNRTLMYGLKINYNWSANAANTSVKLVNFSVRTLSWEKSCARLFATRKKMLRYPRIYHNGIGKVLHMNPFQVMQPICFSIVGPAMGCKMTYNYKSRWFDHVKNRQPKCTIVVNENANLENDQTTEPQSTELSGNTFNENYDVEYHYPQSSWTHKILKSVQNLVSIKHNWSYTKNCPIGEEKIRGEIGRSACNPIECTPHCRSSDAP